MDFILGKKSEEMIGKIIEQNEMTPEQKEQKLREKKDMEDEVRKIVGEIYEYIKKILNNYCDMREEYYDLIAIWIIGTYLHNQFETYPYLFINAMRGSGKTRLLKIIKSIAHNGDLITSLREAVLFRTAKNHTICIDEFEGVNKKENQGLRELLNACYKKGLKVKRMKRVRTHGGEEQVVEEFEPYTPICMANIWGMEEVLGDRCVPIILEKSRNERVMKVMEDFDDNLTIKFIKNGLEAVLVQLCSYFHENTYMRRWNLYVNDRCLYTTTLTTLTTQTPLTTLVFSIFNKVWDTGINGRDLELMFPLILIAHFISEDLFIKILDIAKTITKEKREEEMIESKDISLFDFISHLSEMNEYYSIKALTYQFREYLGDDDADDRWLNAKWFGRALNRLKLVIDKRRQSSGTEVTLNIKKAKEMTSHFGKK